MHHLLAFNASVAASLTDSQLPALADQEFSRQNSNFEIKNPLWIIAMYASGLGLVRARINTATLRLQGFPQIQPTTKVLLPPTDPNVYDARLMPLPLRPQEDFRIDVTTDATAGPNQTYALAWVKEVMGQIAMPPDRLRWIRATVTLTTVAQAWSGLGTVVFDDTQESTRYEVWGMEVFETNTIAARLQFQGQAFRPGCIGNASAGLRSHDMFRGEKNLGLGLYGVYDTYQAPQLEVLANTAAAVTVEVFLLVRKVA